MSPSNQLKDAIQTGLIDPIKKSFAKEQESLTAINKRLLILTVIVLLNLLVTVGVLVFFIIEMH